LAVAEALQEGLYNTLDVELWNQGTFGLTDITIDALVRAGNYFDFAILVLTPDDQVIINGENWFTPRDNVLLEYGFFLGRIGRTRTFIVHEKHERLKLPSDTYGITCASYYATNGKNFSPALGPACKKIKEAIEVELAKQQGEASIRQEQIRRLIHGGLQVVCRALSRPKTPEQAKLRAFIFIKVDSELVCSHFWAPFPVEEIVGELRFGMNDETEKQVAIVRAARQKKVCAVPITFLPEQLTNMHGKIERTLCFVLAAPILSPSGEVLGTVDFDASSKLGEKILKSEVSHNVLFELGKLLHLAMIK
jgi:hypothetical protein